VHTHLASLEAQIAQLLQAQKDGDLRTKLVASRHQRQMADEQSLARRLDARAKEHSLSADQAEASDSWRANGSSATPVVLQLWERGADLTTLQQAIKQDDTDYQREFDASLTEDQRRRRDAGTENYRAGKVSR
jgi:hypothetical protein